MLITNLKLNKMYKIEEEEGVLILFRRRLWIMWFRVETKRYKFAMHRSNIIRRWKAKYGAENFIEE